MEYRYWHLTNTRATLEGLAGSILFDRLKSHLTGDLPPEDFIAPFSTGRRRTLPGPVWLKMSGYVPLHPLMMVAGGMWIARRDLATRLGAVLGKQVQLLDCDSDLEDLTH